MKIVKQSAELLWITPNPEKQIEIAGRTCYKSEDKITDESASKFVKNIDKRGHHSVIEHASASFRIITDRGISHEIVRHRIASFCLSGDTIIPRYNNNKRGLSINELYDRQNDGQLSGRNKLMLLRSMNEHGKIVPNKFVKIIFSGKKGVYNVKTSNGYEIKTTDKHIFFTPIGELKLESLSVGSDVYVNGIELVKDKDWLKYQYYEKCNSLSSIASMANCSYSTVRKYLKIFGLTKEIGAKPKDFAPWNKGLSEFDDPRVAKQAKLLRESNPIHLSGDKHPYWKGDNLQTLSGKRNRFCKYTKDKCEWCGSTERLENHHKDHNPENFLESNKLTLCAKCHSLHHRGVSVRHVTIAKITSIEFVGFEDTYDIEMESPYHNFVANGFIVHNSQESTRYCNYSSDKFDKEISVIEPPDLTDQQTDEWAWSCERSELAYFEMMKIGCSAQIARSVLPTCLKTEVVMTCNFREWIHFIKMRGSMAAHPQVREVARMIRDELKKHSSIFDIEIYGDKK